jgi:uncharacterized membrane protein
MEQREFDARDGVLPKNRIEALTDGFFAIAMTILVLDIKVPQVDQGVPLLALLAQILPEISEYIVAFLALAVFWILHHQLFHYFRSIDNRMLWLNILSLLGIGLVPFSSALADIYDIYMGERLADILFGIILLVISTLFYLQWTHATKDHLLVDRDLRDETIRHERRRTLIIPVISLAGIIISGLTRIDILALYYLIPVIFALYPSAAKP